MCALFYYRRHLSQSLKTPLYPPLCLMDTNMFLYEKRKQGESNKKPQDAVTQCWLFIAQRWAQERVVLCQDDSRSSDHALEESVHKKCGHQEALFEKLYSMSTFSTCTVKRLTRESTARQSKFTEMELRRPSCGWYLKLVISIFKKWIDLYIIVELLLFVYDLGIVINSTNLWVMYFSLDINGQ